MSQQELFESRYRQISQTDRVGWTDEIGLKEALESISKLFKTTSISEGKFLELGCGRANISLHLAQEGFSVTGVDFSSTAITWAQSLATSLRVSAELIVSDLRKAWPFEDQMFDVVFDANCLHFFHGVDRNHFYEEAKRVLHPGGIFILSTCVGFPEAEHWELLGYDPGRKVTVRNGVVMNAFLEEHEVLAELELAGFETIEKFTTRVDHDLLWVAARIA